MSGSIVEAGKSREEHSALEGGKKKEDGDLSHGWRLSLVLPVVQILLSSIYLPG